MDKPPNVNPGDSVLTSKDVFALHAGEWGWVEGVFRDGVSVHFPVNPTGFELWHWSEIEQHCAAPRKDQ